MTYNLTLTPISCVPSDGWVVLKNYLSSSTENKQLLLTYNLPAELGAAGVNITSITIHGYVRNGQNYNKNLRMGFRPAANSGVSTWGNVDGVAALDSAFQVIERYTKSSGMAYKEFTRSYNGSHIFAKWIQQQSAAGEQLYLGVIQPESMSLSVNTETKWWTMDITYELLGNIPTADKTTAKLGETVTTTLNRIISDSTTTLNYKIGENVIASEDVGTATTHAFTVPESAGSAFPNSATATMTVEAVTSQSGTEYGTLSTSFTVTLPEDAAPTAGMSVSRVWSSTVPSASQIAAYVQKQAGASAAITGSAKYGASIASVKLSVEGSEYRADSTSATFTHLPFTGSGNIVLTATVTDTRGNAGTTSETVNVLPWTSPTIQAFTIQRATETGTIAIDGTCAQADATASVSSLKSSGVNLFRWSESSTTQTSRGCTLEWDASTETFHLYGTTTSTTVYPGFNIPSTDCAWLQNGVSGKTFTFSCVDDNTNPKAYLSFTGKKSDGTGTDTLFRVYNGKSATYTVADDVVSLNVIMYAYTPTTDSLDEYFKIQVEEGSTATPWSKYSPGEQNTLQFLIQYREIGSTDWSSADAITATDISSTISGLLTGSGAVLDSFNDMSGYEFRLGVSDLYATGYASDQMPTKEQFWDVDEATGKMGFGGDAPTSEETAGYTFYKPAEFKEGYKTYSTTEVDTGNKWIDGKTIYRLVVTTALTTTGYSIRIADLPSNIGTPVLCQTFVHRTTGAWRPIPTAYYGSMNWSAMVYISNNFVDINLGSSFSDSDSVLLILEYTKEATT